jgi:hypothetical protein
VTHADNVNAVSAVIKYVLGSLYDAPRKSIVLFTKRQSPAMWVFQSVRDLRLSRRPSRGGDRLGQAWPRTVIGPVCLDFNSLEALPEHVTRAANSLQNTVLSLYGSGARLAGQVRIPAGALLTSVLLLATHVPAAAAAPMDPAAYRGASSALVLKPHGTAFSQSVNILLDVGELALKAAAAACGGSVAGKDALVALWKLPHDDGPGTPWQERPLDCRDVFSGIVAVASRAFSTYTLALRVGSGGPGRFRTAEATAITLSGSCAPGLDGTYILLQERAGGGPTYGRPGPGGRGQHGLPAGQGRVRLQLRALLVLRAAGRPGDGRLRRAVSVGET